jgi:hypothetical protein
MVVGLDAFGRDPIVIVHHNYIAIRLDLMYTLFGNNLTLFAYYKSYDAEFQVVVAFVGLYLEL